MELKVTAIKPAIKNQHRVNIFVNEKFSFSLDLKQFTDSNLKVGQILNPEQLETFKSLSNFGKLYQRTLEYLLSRPHSIQEVRDYLRRKQSKRSAEANFYQKQLSEPANFTQHKKNKKPAPLISNQDIEQIIAKLISQKYLDDVKFAEYYVENRFQKKGISSRRLRIELIKKGVKQNIIDQVLSSQDNPRSDAAEIQKIINKKRRLGYDDQKLIQYLVRQGFDYQLAQDSVLEPNFFPEMDSQN